MMEKEAKGKGSASDAGPTRDDIGHSATSSTDLDKQALSLTNSALESGIKDTKAVQSTSSMVWDTIAGSISNVIAAVTSSPNSAPPGLLPPPPPLTNEIHLDELDADSSRSRAGRDNVALKKMSLGEQRRSANSVLLAGTDRQELKHLIHALV